MASTMNSGSSELKQIVRGNTPSNAYFSEEDHVQMFSGVCPRHITKVMLKQWLSYRKGTAKDGSAASDANKRKLYLQ